MGELGRAHQRRDRGRQGRWREASCVLPAVEWRLGPVPDQVEGGAADQLRVGIPVDALGGLDLLVNNASRLGPSPLPPLRDYPLDQLAAVYEVDVLAPLALLQLHHHLLVASTGTAVNITSDAGVEAYEGWGGYGSAKAALDQLSAVLGREEPALRVYAFDPGDMRTEMHQAA